MGQCGRRARSRWSAEGYKARRRRTGLIKGAFGRHLAVDVCMQEERARTVASFVSIRRAIGAPEGARVRVEVRVRVRVSVSVRVSVRAGVAQVGLSVW